jgi:hypothetical protein
MLKIGLSIFCLLLCICALLLPERSAFSFNLDYIEFLNRNHQFFINSTACMARKSTFRVKGEKTNIEENLNETESSRCVTKTSCIPSTTSQTKTSNLSPIKTTTHILQAASKKTCMLVSDGKTIDDCETSILANTVIKKINSENHCKTGKLNPLYEEDTHANSSSPNQTNLPNNQNNSNNKSFFQNARDHSFRGNTNNIKTQYHQETSTKF